MVVRSRGLRSKSRKILRKRPRERGMPPVTHALADFPVGARVAVRINPAIQTGMPHIRFQGLTGQVIGKQGNAYRLHVHSGNMLKELVVRAEHLRGVA